MMALVLCVLCSVMVSVLFKWARPRGLQAAQAVCACIAYNLTHNNSASQLQSLEQMPASAAQDITQPLVDSCYEQIQTLDTTASAPEASNAAGGN